jgi:hypothetical protein
LRLGVRVLTLYRRLNGYGIRHPWRFAGASFLGILLLLFVVLLIFHRSLFVGLFGAGGAALGTALATSNRQRGRPMSRLQKLSIVAGMLVGFYVLGILLQVNGLLR